RRCGRKPSRALPGADTNKTCCKAAEGAEAVTASAEFLSDELRDVRLWVIPVGATLDEARRVGRHLGHGLLDKVEHRLFHRTHPAPFDRHVRSQFRVEALLRDLSAGLRWRAARRSSDRSPEAQAPPRTRNVLFNSARGDAFGPT